MLNILIVISLALWLFPLVRDDYVEPIHAAVAILLLIGISALSDARPKKFSFVGGLLKVSFVAATVITFLGNTESGRELAQPLGALFVMGLGFYIIVFGVASKK